MKYTGPIYRPPYEANTPLLQVTVGCAHNKCTFCTMYKDVRFSVESIEQVEKDILEAKEIYHNPKRIFLVNGDAFVLSANKLRPIAKLINEHLPSVEVITMYASINNVKGKTDEQLRELKSLGINELWIGAETGHKETLEYLNKGFSIEDSYLQLERLNQAGIRFFYGFMFGAAGKGKGLENAIANAEIINKTKPFGIVPTTLGTFGDSQMAQDVEHKIFEPASEQEILEEQKKLLELIDIDTYYMGIHALNSVNFDAVLPLEKEKSIQRINENMQRMGEVYLNTVAKRQSI